MQIIHNNNGDYMKIRLGYAAISKTLEITTSRTLTYTNYLKKEKEEGLRIIDEKIRLNLEALKQMMIYNIRNNFHFYRMTSNLIPLSTKEDVEFNYIQKYSCFYKEIGILINKYNLRVDLHTDQYCVINSVNKDIVKNSINVLKSSKDILDALGIKNAKIIMHVGSNAFGKENSIKRFKNNFKKLDNDIQKMIILENDDKIFNVEDVLEICKDLNIPMVLDYHHYICNNNGIRIESIIEEIFSTWAFTGLNPKIHFSSPKNKTKKDFRSHHDFIDSDSFIEFIDKIKFSHKDIDIMIEAKMKDVALCKLVRELKYKTNYKFIDETTFEV